MNGQRTARRARGCRGAVLLGLLCLAGCGKEENPTREVEPGKVVDSDKPIAWNMDAKTRLRAQMPGAPMMGGSGMGGSTPGMSGDVPPAVDSSQPSPLKWKTPTGWTEVEATSMRLANFQAGDPSVECYVVMLGGGGGGVLPNINRWRGQLKLDPVGADAVDAMPHVPQLGADAVLVDIQGESDAMLATISMHGSTAVFVKMLGPKELVQREKQRFIDFCGSLEFRS